MQILLFLYFSCSNLPLPNQAVLPSLTKSIFQGTFKEQGGKKKKLHLHLNIGKKGNYHASSCHNCHRLSNKNPTWRLTDLETEELLYHPLFLSFACADNSSVFYTQFCILLSRRGFPNSETKQNNYIT